MELVEKLKNEVVTFDQLNLTDRYTLLQSLPTHYMLALEIGVWQGWYTGHIIGCTQMHVTGVDPWVNTESYHDNIDVLSEDFNPMATGSDGYLWHETRYISSLSVLSRQFHPSRYRLIRSFSYNYVKFIPDEHFDFIYIDGEHTYKAVKQDINDWWSKVKPGGILAGHDYIEDVRPDNSAKLAVDEFAERNNLEFKITGITPGSGDAAAPSWLFIKG